MEELAIVLYAGHPHPIMIRYMLDEAKGNNVNAGKLRIRGGTLPREGWPRCYPGPECFAFVSHPLCF
jgi:hypothetical protein